MNDKIIKVGQKSPLVENLLVIEGITRSGKFLLANILNGFEGIEPPQYSGLLEQIPFLTTLGLIKEDAAKQLLRCEVDMRCYEMLIGRNLNYRISDKSSIYNVPNYQKFLDRVKKPDGEIAAKEFSKKVSYSLFVLHESMANIMIFFETFPKMKCISLTRKPLGLAYSWYKRGLGKRWGTDPLLFQIPFTTHKNIAFPWFAIGWEDLYLKSSEIDRAVLSIKSLVKLSQKGYRDLPQEIRNNILIVSFESLITDPKKEIDKISKFLGKKVLPQMKDILKREKLPIDLPENKEEKKLKEIKTIANKKYLEELLDLPTNYLDV